MPQHKQKIYNVSGMHCTACASRLEKGLARLNGVTSCTVNFAAGIAQIHYMDDKINDRKLMDSAKSIGYELHESEEIIEEKPKKFTIDDARVIIAWVLSVIIIIPTMFFHQTLWLSPYSDILLSGIVLFFSGYEIIKSGISSIKDQSLGMDVLIALGGFAAWISAWLPVFGIIIPNYAMTAAMLITINLTGHRLEDMARGAASKAVGALSRYGNKIAHKVNEDGSITDIPTTNLIVGDIIQVKAGEKIPSDGIILSGSTSVDESFLTGESLPIDKKINDYVVGASLNIDGFITVRIEKTTDQNMLAQTVRLIQEAQGTKVPIQILADKITGFFVPIIIIISLLCFSIWFAFPNVFPNILQNFGLENMGNSRLSSALSAAIAVLVIACPCALGLATPMALVNGSTLGAKRGILIRRGVAVQNLNKIDVVAMDKTGTLTIGKPKVTRVMFNSSVSENFNQQKALEILMGLEKISTHPLAHAVLEYATEQKITGITIDQSSNIPGEGIIGNYQNEEWFAGSLKSTLEKGIQIHNPLRSQMEEQQMLGESLICLSNLSKNTCVALISFSDTINPEAIEAVTQLKKMGKKIVMVTGDHKNAAQALAKKIGIGSVIAECSPKRKLESVNSLQQQGQSVCFVGDGINDAAALEASDVGIAIGTGTDIAAEAGDLILVHGSLSALVTSFKLAKATFGKIKQNLFWAFFYNIVAIPLAFMGVLHPIVAEIAMMFSSITVIFNSILLSHKKL